MTRPAPLNWLQAFEAAGRLGTFKAAAEELHVSPSNVSHQIRDLEAHLGVLLFRRVGGRVSLTAEGARFLPALSAGFRSIREASPTGAAARRLHVGAFPFLANEILAPHLDALRARLPDTEIRLFTQSDRAALLAERPEDRLDVVVGYGSGRISGYGYTRLADVQLVPVVAADARIEQLDDLLAAPFIRVIGPFQGWDLWQARFCPKAETPSFSLETDSFHAAMLAVERGEGVCLGVLPYVSEWVRQGRIRALSDWTLDLDGQGAYAIYAPFQQGNPTIETFANWLVERLT